MRIGAPGIVVKDIDGLRSSDDIARVESSTGAIGLGVVTPIG